MKRLQSFAPALAIFGFALLVRVIYNNTVAFHYTPTHDSLFYQTIGLNLLREHCFCLHPNLPTVYRAPLWPFIIAAISIFSGQNDYILRIFLSLVGSGTCLLIYLFARDLFGWRIGILAGVAAAIYPWLFIYDGWLYTESLFTFLLFAFCYVLYRQQRHARSWGWILCGILLGLISLTRPNGLLVIALFILWVAVMVWKKVIPWRIATRSVAISTLLAIAIIAPWTIRNYIVSHAFVPVATGDGTVLLGAYNNMVLTQNFAGGFYGSWINPLISSPKIANQYPPNCSGACEVTRENAFKNYAEQWILSHKRTTLRILELHATNLWLPFLNEVDLPTYRFPHQQSTQLVLSMMRNFTRPFFVLAAFGLLVTLWRWREFLFIYLMILMTIVEGIIFYSSPRFRAPIEPMLILLAAGAIWWLTHKESGTLRWLLSKFHKRKKLAAVALNKPEVSSPGEQTITGNERIGAGDK